MISLDLLLLVIFVVWNIFVFIIYGIDKDRAKNKKIRISEKTLLMSAVLMGGIGALIGMKIFRHKTKHVVFKICVPLALLFNLTIVVMIYYNFL